MDSMSISRAMKWLFARVICFPAILMPYHLRILYIRMLSSGMHAPFRFFGRISRTLLSRLHIAPMRTDAPLPPIVNSTPIVSREGSVAVLYSGGTDSTCATAMMASRFSHVHLLTFYEYATRHSPVPIKNVALLQKAFPHVHFESAHISVDGLVRFFWYERYLQMLRAHGWFVLATCGFSSLSWHVRTIVYCLDHGITHVADGLTRELMHFPGHMDAVVEQFRALYAAFGITYENPVREWPTPPDQQFIDRVVVNTHGGEYYLGDSDIAQRKTTGAYLYEIGIMPHPNVKGSALDFSMQHDCYPFALYNILAFWGYSPGSSWHYFSQRIESIMTDKIACAQELLAEYHAPADTSKLKNLISHT